MHVAEPIPQAEHNRSHQDSKPASPIAFNTTTNAHLLGEWILLVQLIKAVFGQLILASFNITIKLCRAKCKQENNLALFDRTT